jgi:hypothetical protein
MVRLVMAGTAVTTPTAPKTPAPTRLAHALTTGAGPVHAGERPHITMTVHYDALTNRLGAATLDATGTTISPADSCATPP